MRAAFAVAVLLGAGAMTVFAQPKEPEPRYGLKVRDKQFPQATPKETLRSVLAAMEKGEYPYLVAHLLEPKFVDAAVEDRVKLYEAAAEIDLAKLRDYQRSNPGKVDPRDRVPQDPKAFRDMALGKARVLAFRQLVKDVTQKLADDPQVIKDLRRILSDGSFTGAADTATATHDGVKNRTLYFKNVDGRWVIENRQVEEKKE
jgi:hypothetical protein